MSTPFLQTRGLTRQYPGVLAVDRVDLDINPGEVIGLVGKNGAGKTTVIKMLAGAEKPDAGTILMDGEAVEIRNPHHATELGLAFLHQELLDAPNLSVAENISLGLGYPRRGGLLVDWRRLNQSARVVLNMLNANIDPRVKVSKLSVVKQRLVMIARAVNRKARLVVLDEPTASLSEQEIRHLHEVINWLRERGVAVLYVSHRLDEILAITDRTVVMRDGRLVADQPTTTLDRAELVALITGGRAGLTAASRRQAVGIGGRPDTPDVLRVEDISAPGVVEDCSLDLREGELLGIAGLVGAGRSEFVRLLFGADPRQGGKIFISGEEADIRSPKMAMRAGVALLPEDRRTQGAVMGFSVRKNITLATLRRHRIRDSIPAISVASERAAARDAVDRLGIRTPHIEQPLLLLSGGNQQKVVLAKWLERGAKVFVFDEPTRGIDVEGKEEIYRLMEAIAAERNGVIFISSELEELVAVCQRVVIMRSGRIVGQLEGEAVAEERIIQECFTAS
jgi:ABC-type sugar transport system ATPase subunit